MYSVCICVLFVLCTQTIVARMMELGEPMTPKCLISILDILLSLVAVGIPERVQHHTADCEERLCEERDTGEDADEDVHAEGVDKGAPQTRRGDKGRRQPDAASQVAECDCLEGLLLDGTLAVHRHVLLQLPWPVVYFVCTRLHEAHHSGRCALVHLLYQAYCLDTQRFVGSVCELSE